MAQYQKIEYRIGKDGKISEKVINGIGSSCTQTTASLENSLGVVEEQKLLPEYYQGEDNLIVEDNISLNQM